MSNMNPMDVATATDDCDDKSTDAASGVLPNDSVNKDSSLSGDIVTENPEGRAFA